MQIQKADRIVTFHFKIEPSEKVAFFIVRSHLHCVSAGKACNPTFTAFRRAKRAIPPSLRFGGQSVRSILKIQIIFFQTLKTGQRPSRQREAGKTFDKLLVFLPL